MAQKNRTRFAILGMLAYQPMSGYDIKKMIDNSIAYFWKENYGHIYPVLAELNKEGLIKLREREKKKEAKGGPERKVYEITEQGGRAIKKWLYEPHAAEYSRIELLLKLFFGMLVPMDISIAAIERERNAAINILEEFKNIRKKSPSAPCNGINLFPLITLNYGEKHYKAVIEWCDETLALLKKNKKGVEK
ncbi:MAG: PadR family transcriptional regulator [Candidatus Goldiibacteriota bacterium]